MDRQTVRTVLFLGYNAQCPLFNPLIPLPILLVHALQHLVRDPSHKHLLLALTFGIAFIIYSLPLAFGLYDPQVAVYVVSAQRGRMDGDMGLAVQQASLGSRLTCRGG
jgi:hypothetical protein